MIFDIFQRLKAKHRHQDVRQGRAVSLVSVLMDRLRQKEAEQHLSGLTPQRAVELFSNYRAGKYADVQLVWDELEEQDDTLKSIVDSRLGGLAEMPWRVSVRADLVGDNQELQTLAEQQQRYVESLLRGVDNLEEAIEHLGMADFRGYAALEVTGEPGHMRWEVIEPWNLARPARNGPWLYNPEAQDSTNKLEELEMRRVILRETRRPIDLAAMFLIVEKSHGTHAWDAFLDTFGVPSIFFELAPNTSEEDAQEFDAVINRVLAEGRGTLPSGTKVQTVETSQNSSDAYKTRAEWCRDALLTLGLGGTLTATAESGSGTLAGNAHADSLARLCARSARGIGTAINRCFCWPEARKRFPGAPLLVEFDLSHEEEEDKQALATMFATLAGARYRAEDAVVSEHLGVEVTTEPMQPAMPGMMSRAAACGSGVASRAEEERTRLESREDGKAEGGEPLTAEELALMKQYGEAGSLDLGKLAGEYEKRLEEAARAGFEGAEDEFVDLLSTEECEAKDPSKCPYHATIEQAAEAVRNTPIGGEILSAIKEFNDRSPGEQYSTVHHLLHAASPRLADDIKEQSGRDLSGYRHSISAMGIAHAQDHRLSDDEYLLIPDITNNYDTVTYGVDKRGAKITYTKAYGNEEYLLVERIGNSKHGKLFFTTEYVIGKKKERGTGNSPEVGSP